MELGRQIARELLDRGMRRVVIAALREQPPVREVAVSHANEPNPGWLGAPGEFAGRPIGRRPAVSAVILGAGLGKRMGQLKLGLPLGGKSLLRRVVEAALAAPVDEVVVVLGHGAADLQRELPEDARLRAVYNPNYAEGQSSSLRAGVSALRSNMEAAVFLLGDQPLVSAGIIKALVHAFRTSRAPLLQPLYRGVPGNPVLFARAFFPELMEVRGDQGGREVLARHQSEVTRLDLDLEMPLDVDTVADYERLRGMFPED
jgi:molybdenum cofactor cytidylyltransferase